MNAYNQTPEQSRYSRQIEASIAMSRKSYKQGVALGLVGGSTLGCLVGLLLSAFL